MNLGGKGGGAKEDRLCQAGQVGVGDQRPILGVPKVKASGEHEFVDGPRIAQANQSKIVESRWIAVGEFDPTVQEQVIVGFDRVRFQFEHRPGVAHDDCAERTESYLAERGVGNTQLAGDVDVGSGEGKGCSGSFGSQTSPDGNIVDRLNRSRGTCECDDAPASG